jgi:hypothetical protein
MVTPTLPSWTNMYWTCMLFFTLPWINFSSNSSP